MLLKCLSNAVLKTIELRLTYLNTTVWNITYQYSLHVQLICHTATQTHYLNTQFVQSWTLTSLQGVWWIFSVVYHQHILLYFFLAFKAISLNSFWIFQLQEHIFCDLLCVDYWNHFFLPQFEQALGSLPDSRLPVANQLEQAITTIKSNVKVILDIQGENKVLKKVHHLAVDYSAWICINKLHGLLILRFNKKNYN